MSVIDAQPQLRHLVLMSREANGKHKFLCGHDERHWFVAAVPEDRPVSTVRTALEALKPDVVQREQTRRYVKSQRRNRRRNEAFVRQGEWFFVPLPEGTRLDASFALRNEPLRRGAGKPHIVDELVRDGGESVYISHLYPNGLTAREYQRLISRRPEPRSRAILPSRRRTAQFGRLSIGCKPSACTGPGPKRRSTLNTPPSTALPATSGRR